MRLPGTNMPPPHKSVPGPHQGTPTPPTIVGVTLPQNRFYAVKQGDTLLSLSMKFYNYPDWPRIFNANQEVIANPDHLVPGTIIKIP